MFAFRYHRLLKAFGFFTLSFALLWILFYLFTKFISPFQIKLSYSTIVVNQKDKILHAFLSKDDKWRMQTSADEVADDLKKIIIEKEDKYFYYHFGVNPVAIGRAIFNNLVRQRKTSGASTITMQVVRLLEPRPRTYWNKLFEIFQALRLEICYTKKEIFSTYLTLVPFGGNIEGVKSAAFFYYGKSPSHLSLAQATVLSIVPNKPTSWALKKSNTNLLIARNRWLKDLERGNLFSQSAIQDALKESLELKRRPSPKQIPHLAIRLRNENPNLPVIKTFIDERIQYQIEQLVNNYAQTMKKINVFNSAVLVVDNSRQEVIAYLGSQNFSDNIYSGQIDGVQAFRSPGSTLKPLLYGLSFDMGIATPKTVIADIPTNFNGFEPENFDNKFNGSVTIEQALIYSLNIPAVKILEKVDKKNFIDLLIKANFKQINKYKNSLGLSMILGGCNTNLEELTFLYSALANEGRYNLPKYSNQIQHFSSFSVLSEEASYLLSDILSQASRPDLPHQSAFNTHLPKIAWKTGTSYGKKDAWCIGYNTRFTVGLWLGNFNGHGSAELSGASYASPLLFSIFNHVDYNSSAFSFKFPKNLRTRFVCTHSGNWADELCEEPIIDFYIFNKSSMKRCEHMQMKWVSEDEQYSFCSYCVPNGGYKKKLYPNLGQDLIGFYEQEHIPYQKIPPHHPNCDRERLQNSLSIVSPRENQKIYIQKKSPAEVMLQCNAKSGINKVFWYVNDQYYQSTSPQLPVFYQPKPGKLKVSCSDGEGYSTSVMLEVFYD
ncbi:MAG: penicillin-binding protein 1C [Cytophagales bacterium]|nr:MAG: penicillin-binding protein 1C [Cytophagales bacterium]